MTTARLSRRGVFEALVWRRSDFRESSRIVTLVTREEGRISALIKGAHRPSSPALGRIDLFNRLQVTLSGPVNGLRLLSRVRLLDEPRGLRDPRRYLAACHLHDIFDPAFVPGRADRPLFELVHGGLVLLERCPPAALATIIAGVELRYLETLGLLPELDRCSSCAQPTNRLFLADGGGLLCREHAGGAEASLPPAVVAWLLRLQRCPGREWSLLPPAPRQGSAHALLGSWVAAAIERRAKFRDAALARVGYLGSRRGDRRT